MKNKITEVLRSHLIEIRSLYSKYIRENEIDEIADEIMELLVEELTPTLGYTPVDWAGLDPAKWGELENFESGPE